MLLLKIFVFRSQDIYMIKIRINYSVTVNNQLQTNCRNVVLVPLTNLLVHMKEMICLRFVGCSNFEGICALGNDIIQGDYKYMH